MASSPPEAAPSEYRICTAASFHTCHGKKYGYKRMYVCYCRNTYSWQNEKGGVPFLCK